MTLLSASVRETPAQTIRNVTSLGALKLGMSVRKSPMNKPLFDDPFVRKVRFRKIEVAINRQAFTV